MTEGHDASRGLLCFCRSAVRHERVTAASYLDGPFVQVITFLAMNTQLPELSLSLSIDVPVDAPVAEPADPVMDQAAQHYVQGRQHKAAGHVAAAERSYREALRLHPGFVEAWISLGILLRGLHRTDEAEQCQRQAVQIDPDNHVALTNLGNILKDRGLLAEAEKCLRQALQLKPDSAEAHNNLGRVLLQAGEFKQAAPHFAQAEIISPGYFLACEGLGVSLFNAGFYEDAVPALQNASRLRPDDLYLQLMLANAHQSAGQFKEAEASYVQLLKHEYGAVRAKATAGIASVYAMRGQYDQAQTGFEAALALEPDDFWIQGHYSQLLLRKGEFARGWDCYEHRWQAEQQKRVLNRNFPQPRWQGESLAGKTLLLISEQGLGDEIMFASILNDVAGEAAHCIVECDQRLLSLFQRSFPQVTFFPVSRKVKHWYRQLEAQLDHIPEFDYWTSIGNLPRFRRREASRFPRHQGYLSASQERVAHWRNRLDELGAGLKIGISWRGGTQFTNVAKRTLTLQQLAPVLNVQGAHFVNLQYGDCAAELADFATTSAVPIHHWQEAIDDYDETAALVGALDLVISVCTAVVHLGGALGRPVWVMAPCVPEWRYGWRDAGMIWYPSVHMFRQQTADEWSPVIADVKRRLTSHAK